MSPAEESFVLNFSEKTCSNPRWWWSKCFVPSYLPSTSTIISLSWRTAEFRDRVTFAFLNVGVKRNRYTASASSAWKLPLLQSQLCTWIGEGTNESRSVLSSSSDSSTYNCKTEKDLQCYQKGKDRWRKRAFLRSEDLRWLPFWGKSQLWPLVMSRPSVSASYKKLKGILSVTSAQVEWIPTPGQSSATPVTIPVGLIRRIPYPPWTLVDVGRITSYTADESKGHDQSLCITESKSGTCCQRLHFYFFTSKRGLWHDSGIDQTCDCRTE